MYRKVLFDWFKSIKCVKATDFSNPIANELHQNIQLNNLEIPAECGREDLTVPPVESNAKEEEVSKQDVSRQYDFSTHNLDQAKETQV
jgi:hypothetical protein